MKTIDFEQLPHALEEIDFSHNKLDGYVIIKNKDQIFKNGYVNYKNVKDSFLIKSRKLSYSKIDFSHNLIDSMYVLPTVNNLNISNNNLVYLSFHSIGGDTLNISNNKDFDNIVTFRPDIYENIIYENIKNDQPLQLRKLFQGAIHVINKED